MTQHPPIPTFLIIGAQKAATTSVYYGMKQHPDIFLSTPKELHFFSLDPVFAKGWKWYLSHFDGARHAAIGEASTSYSSSWLRPRTVYRIKEHLPALHIIYVVRHPLRRIESHWMHQWRFSQVATDFSTSVCTNRELIDCSLYWKQISAYRDAYDDSKIHIIFSEDFARDAAAELRRVSGFLGLDPGKLPISARLDRIHNPSIGPAASQQQRILTERPSWDRAVLEAIRDEVREDARRLLAFCGKPDDYWADL